MKVPVFLLPFFVGVRFNPLMERLKHTCTPRFDRATIVRNLPALLVSGALADGDMDRRIASLTERFGIYTSCYPLGLWAPGLAVTREMRHLTEIYLPLDEIRRAFDRFFAIACRFSPFIPASTIHNSTDWLDILLRLQPLVSRPDPAFLLRSLIGEESSRRCFIFANFMPARYGGGFGRYPGQAELLRRWLGANRSRLAGGVRCLDAACGSGEGTYELALLLMESGFSAASIHLHGTTLEPLELFAAAHAHFPHDPEREAAYRLHVGPLFESGAAEKISFTLEDLTRPAPAAEKVYDIILCNGLLGGPFIHDQRELLETVRRLSLRLCVRGILLAVSRFHGGWKKIASDEMLREIFRECGLKILPVAEGVAGVRVKGEG
ncbi:MAG TPA: chemotaxis protein CheR [Geobacteraceae bacterium]|nr:chemotaxis protein CheR [Geobacteraceae bacterium]